jgi:hypothetical protein
MKLAHYLFTFLTSILLFTIQSCRPAQVLNVRSNFNTETKKLSLKVDLIGNPKNKYDLDIKLAANNLEYKILQNEISPKQINIGPANDLAFTIISKSEILNDNYFLVKLKPKRRKLELTQQEVLAIKADTNKSIQDQLINPTVNFAATNKSFVYFGTNPLNNFSSTNISNLSLGFGHIYSKMGYYFEVGSTLSQPINSNIKNNKKNVISDHSSNIYYSFTNNKRIDRSYLIAGALIRIVPSVIGSIGIGYGKRTELWEVEEIITSGNSYDRSIKFSENVNSSFRGPQLQLGVLFDFNGTNIKISTNFLPQTGQYISPAPYLECGISLGINI